MDEVALKFERRQITQRPRIAVEISRTDKSVWPMFRPYHYMSADLVPAARCFGAFTESEIIAFVAVIHFPHPKPSACGYRIHRLVTLPDWQGVGIGMVLLDAVASAYSSLSHSVRMPAMHPSLIRTLDKSPRWRLEKKPGVLTARTVGRKRGVARMGGRACAQFRYVGEKLDRTSAERLLA